MRLNTNRLREVAAEHGDTSDYKIAKRANVSQSTMSRLVNGNNLPGATTLAKFRTAYQLTAEELLILDDLPIAA
jgi:transcriptional regulator with XRE-family HTH domain